MCRFVVEADDYDGLSAVEEFGWVDALFEIFMKPGHLAGVAGVEPAHKVIKIIGMQRGCVGNTDEVKAEFEGLLLYLFGQAHFYAQKKRM